MNVIELIFCSKELQGDIIFLPNINAHLLITNTIFFTFKLFSFCFIDFPDLSLSPLLSGTIKQSTSM